MMTDARKAEKKKWLKKHAGEKKLTRKDLPYTIGMILLDIAAPILLMLGLKSATSANASLLGNFEIVATSLIALFLFREKISRRLWIAIALITLSSGILSFEDMSSLHFSGGSLLVLAAAACWGLENNCTRNISDKSTFEIVFLKGIFSGLGSCIIALCIGEPPPKLGAVAAALLLGFVAYGLSIFCYVRAQNALGAAKTSAYYAVAPFIGTALSCIIWRDALSVQYFLALAVMLAGSVLVVLDTLQAVEPLGPRRLAQALVVAPCTGATLARLAAGLSDTPVTLAAKSLLRVGSPVVLAVSTNDGLGASGENMARLCQRKHYYFVPYGQDDPFAKPQSLKADLSLLPAAVDAALRGEQLQPVLLGQRNA